LNLLRAGALRSGVAFRHLAGDAAGAVGVCRGAGACGRDRRLRGVPSCRSTTPASTSSSATRCCHHLPDHSPERSASSGRGAATRRPWCSPSAASRRATETGISAVAESAGAPGRFAPAVARAGRGRRSRNGKRRASPARGRTGSSRVVDVHAFTPADLSRHAGAAGVPRRSGGAARELAASLFGWANRTLEATAEPSEVPWALARVRLPPATCLLQRLDRSLLEPPPAGRRLFYNLLGVGASAGGLRRRSLPAPPSARRQSNEGHRPLLDPPYLPFERAVAASAKPAL